MKKAIKQNRTFAAIKNIATSRPLYLSAIAFRLFVTSGLPSLTDSTNFHSESMGLESVEKTYFGSIAAQLAIQLRHSTKLNCTKM